MGKAEALSKHRSTVTSHLLNLVLQLLPYRRVDNGIEHYYESKSEDICYWFLDDGELALCKRDNRFMYLEIATTRNKSSIKDWRADD
jgi:hypothetical protein